MSIQFARGSYHRAAKDHVCWCCGDVIPKGANYFRQAGKVNGRFFAVKHCRVRCEIVPEILDQNPHLAPAVFHPTLPGWIEEQSDEWKVQHRKTSAA